MLSLVLNYIVIICLTILYILYYYYVFRYSIHFQENLLKFGIQNFAKRNNIDVI